MSSRNITSSPGLRYGFARALGHMLGRSARWYASLNTNWKLSLAGVGIVAPIWLYRDHIRSKRRAASYNRAVKDYVFFDIAIGARYVGRVLIGLYTDNVPMTCENFIQLAEGYRVGDKIIGYRNTPFHNIIPDVGMVGGDVVTGDGTHQLSIYGPRFVDENFDMDFIQDGDVCCYSNTVDANGSQFMITFRQMKTLYGHLVVFGTVVKGMRIIRMIQDLSCQFNPKMDCVRIVNCGLYRGYQDGPPFFSCTEALDKFDEGAMDEDTFRCLPVEDQEKIVERHRAIANLKVEDKKDIMSAHVPEKENLTNSDKLN